MITNFKIFEAKKAIYYKICDVKCVFTRPLVKNFTVGNTYELMGARTFGITNSSFKAINNKGNYTYVYPYNEEKRSLTAAFLNEFTDGYMSIILTRDEDYYLKKDMKQYNL